MALARIILLRGRSPNDKARTAEYDSGAHKGLDDQIQKGLATSVPPDAHVTSVAESIGKQPFRIHIDPAQDFSEVVNAVADRIRAEFLRRTGLDDLLTPRVND